VGFEGAARFLDTDDEFGGCHRGQIGGEWVFCNEMEGGGGGLGGESEENTQGSRRVVKKGKRSRRLRPSSRGEKKRLDLLNEIPVQKTRGHRSS